jgi:hypothetical protein
MIEVLEEAYEMFEYGLIDELAARELASMEMP